MAVKLRGLDRYEVEAIQYDGTNSDEIVSSFLSSFLSINPIHKSRERS